MRIISSSLLFFFLLNILNVGVTYGKYTQDGTIFENREGFLPIQQYGYYTERTVDTPGSTNRGLRRIVKGTDEMYYSLDHYTTLAGFTKIR